MRITSLNNKENGTKKKNFVVILLRDEVNMCFKMYIIPNTKCSKKILRHKKMVKIIKEVKKKT